MANRRRLGKSQLVSGCASAIVATFAQIVGCIRAQMLSLPKESRANQPNGYRTNERKAEVNVC